MSDGQELRQIALGCYRARKSERAGRSVYGGWEWGSAVGKAMEQGIKEGKRKDRRQAAEEITEKIFDKARTSSAERLERVAACVGPNSSLIRASAGSQSELEVLAGEIMAELGANNAHEIRMGASPEDLVSGMIDISMIISLIMGIITAIRQCRNPQPTPVPTPA